MASLRTSWYWLKDTLLPTQLRSAERVRLDVGIYRFRLKRFIKPFSACLDPSVPVKLHQLNHYLTRAHDEMYLLHKRGIAENSHEIRRISLECLERMSSTLAEMIPDIEHTIAASPAAEYGARQARALYGLKEDKDSIDSLPQSRLCFRNMSLVQLLDDLRKGVYAGIQRGIGITFLVCTPQALPNSEQTIKVATLLCLLQRLLRSVHGHKVAQEWAITKTSNVLPDALNHHHVSISPMLLAQRRIRAHQDVQRPPGSSASRQV
ncbi:hypothetical protein K461DRAFT_311095 [Myriangium duriaei CBS 260.36]|uniref:Uncharacterized protein n=1 Tax=Myriangium duriaei CBS 260.36 TaxID=1168546 RepID=A0A9P4J3A9_9PEZI|nr:hypothetical protein K461DRAFT_311095 [Myriangium duriaei CBS 260.36]